MRLALLGHFPVDAPPQGGVQSVLANLADAFVRHGNIELHLIQHRRGIPDGAFVREGYTVHDFAARQSRGLPNMLRTGSLVTPLLRDLRPDAISTHQPEYALAAFDTGLPVLHTIHGFPSHEFWARRGVFVRTATLWEVWLERRMLARARHLVAISDYVINAYRSRTRARFHRIDNPVAPLFFAPGPAPEPGRLLLVGNLTTRKGVETAIAAVARLRTTFPGVVLDIIGAPVDPVYAGRLRTQAEPLAGAVRFLAPTTQAGIKQALDRAQVLVLTSREEHTPVIVAEAMAAGRPVVATNVGALAGMVAPGETGYLVPPGNGDTVAAAVAALLSDPDHAAELGAEAARRAQVRFHPTAVASAYLTALQAAMEA
jgi:glycosyltransferase involved in cell wall biosynthesis